MPIGHRSRCRSRRCRGDGSSQTSLDLLSNGILELSHDHCEVQIWILEATEPSSSPVLRLVLGRFLAKAGGYDHEPPPSSHSLEKQFESFRVQLEEYAPLREHIRAVVMEIESATMLIQANLLIVHQSRPLPAFVYLSFKDLWFNHKGKAKLGFVKRNETLFVVDDMPLYVNGWNSYWFMDHAVDEHSRNLVGEMLEAGAKMGLTVCRTWAFNDGGYNALQISPGRFDERVFHALDHVIAEAKKQDVRLLLSLVNNLQAYGGKT